MAKHDTIYEVEFIPSPNHSSRGTKEIVGGVLHYTAAGDVEGVLRWFKNRAAKASSHYLLSRSGRTFQMVSEERAAWHAGSRTTTPRINGKKNVNQRTIGIEICNWGPLYRAEKDEEVWFEWNGKREKRYRKEGSLYTWPKNWTMPYRGMQAEKASTPILSSQLKSWPGAAQTVDWWEPYPPVQMRKLHQLLEDIVERYGWSREWIVRHQDVDPTRKIDTGPVFKLESLLDQVFTKPEEETEIVLSNKGGPQTEVSVSPEEFASYHAESRNERPWHKCLRS